MYHYITKTLYSNFFQWVNMLRFGEDVALKNCSQNYASSLLSFIWWVNMLRFFCQTRFPLKAFIKRNNPYKLLLKVGQHQPFCHAFCSFFYDLFLSAFYSVSVGQHDPRYPFNKSNCCKTVMGMLCLNKTGNRRL